MAKSKAEPPQPGSTYWDSTVFLDLFFQESPRAGIAKALWQEALAGKHSICTSFLTISEVLFTAAEANKQFSAKEEREIAALWHPDSPVRFIELTAAIGNDARTIKRECMARNIPMMPMDALHLASARAVKATRFFTSDKFNRKPCKKATMPDQRTNLAAIVGFTICDPDAKGKGVIVFGAGPKKAEANEQAKEESEEE